MSTSGSCEGTTEMVPEERPLMPAELIAAAIKGDSNVLVPRLGLQADGHGEHNHLELDIDGTSSPTAQQTDGQFDIQSATNSGNTILHLLVMRGHNELAEKVFQKEKSLLNARNKKCETPLHIAATYRNTGIINIFRTRYLEAVKDAVGVTNNDGETPLHVAAKHGHNEGVYALMSIDKETAYKVNKEGFTPLPMAIANKHRVTAGVMLKDATLAITEDSNGMFPIHVAAEVGNEYVVHNIVHNYPEYAELLDPQGRNFLHIAAENKQYNIFIVMLSFKEVTKRMMTATDHEGNTPLHIAAMKLDRPTMELMVYQEIHYDAEEVKNNDNLRPLDICFEHLKASAEMSNIDFWYKVKIYKKAHGLKFTKRFFFDFMDPPEKNKWDRVQVVGLGSVLIITLAFAAAFTIPGGYNQENGTPVFAKWYMFKAFILADALAFITAFMSLDFLLSGSIMVPDGEDAEYTTVFYATLLFLLASSCTVVAFAVGLYVTLAPNNMAVAVIILVVSLLFGSPITSFAGRRKWIKFVDGLSECVRRCFCWTVFAFTFMWVFFLAFL